MVDIKIVCCMCGDVGFSDKLFRCTKCHHRFQHSYCSNYYGEAAEAVEECDWCQSKERSSRNSSSSSSNSKSKLKLVGKPEELLDSSAAAGAARRDEMKHDDEKQGSKTTTPSPSRPSTRRYKLLKDVMR